MNASIDRWLAEGVLVTLDREGAKDLFAAGDPAVMRQFVDDQIQRAERSDGDGETSCDFVSCQTHWSTLDQAFQQSASADEAAPSALSQWRGQGRLLCDVTGLRLALVRPDMVPHVAAELADFSTTELLSRLADQPPLLAEAIVEVFGRIQDFYVRAAANHVSVLFAADR